MRSQHTLGLCAGLRCFFTRHTACQSDKKKGANRCGPFCFASVGLFTNQFERLGSMVRFNTNNVGATRPQVRRQFNLTGSCNR